MRARVAARPLPGPGTRTRRRDLPAWGLPAGPALAQPDAEPALPWFRRKTRSTGVTRFPAPISRRGWLCGGGGHALVAPFGQAAVHRAGTVAVAAQQPDRIPGHHAEPAAAVRDDLLLPAPPPHPRHPPPRPGPP